MWLAKLHVEASCSQHRKPDRATEPIKKKKLKIKKKKMKDKDCFPRHCWWCFRRDLTSIDCRHNTLVSIQTAATQPCTVLYPYILLFTKSGAYKFHHTRVHGLRVGVAMELFSTLLAVSSPDTMSAHRILCKI